MLRVRLLGGLELEADERAIDPPTGRPARVLLAWLALHRGMHARSRVAAALWPDVLDRSARLSLRTALSALRDALGDEADAVSATRERIGLAPEVRLDLSDFEELVAAKRFEEALALHRGELLPDLDDDWVLEARDEWRSRLAEAIARLADAEEERGELEAAVQRSRELVAIDPLSEVAQRALIRRLAACGDRGAALSAFERFRERLGSELGIAPAPETRDLVERLRRGKAEPREVAAPSQPPLPPVLARRYRSPFVGRRGELRRLRESWQLAGRGERQLFIVFGEPGIGKSRLAAEFAEEAHSEGAGVLHGRSAEEPLLPYQPFAEALRPHLTTAPTPDGIGELARLVPGLAERAGAAPMTSEDPETARFRLFEAVDSYLSVASRERPLLLILEDLHWADKPTLLLLSHLVNAPDPARLLIIATYRETELSDPLAEVLAELRRQRLGARLRLGGLDEAGVSALVTGWSGPDASAELAPKIHRRTEGNPFFVEEVLSHLSESGSSLAEAGVPEGVKEVVGRRLARLGEDTRRTLAAASVLGRRFDVGVLDAVLEVLSAERLAESLDEAAGAGLVRDEPDRAGSYAFSHALVRETVYEQLTGAHRAGLHGRAAGALERLYGARPERIGAIAYHLFESAAAGSAERGIDYAIQAAELALDQLAYEDTAFQLERALRALELVEAPDDLRRCELLLSLGDARMRAGERADGRAAFGQAATVARALERPDLLARAALGFGGIGVTISAPDDALIELLRDALGSLREADEGLRARLLARLALEHYYVTRERSETLSAEAVTVARETGDLHALADVLNARHVALWTPDRVHDRLGIADEMVRSAERAGDRVAALQGRNWRVLDLFELGEIDAVERELAAYARVVEELKLPTYRWYVPLWRSTLALLRGHAEEATRLADEALALGRRAQDANAELFHRIVLTYHLPIEEGRFEDADLEFQRRTAQDSRMPHVAAAYRAGVARILAGRGRLEEARRELDLVAGQGFESLPKDVNWLGTLVTLSEVAAIVGDAERAEQLYELLLPCAELNAIEARAIYCYGSTAYYLGTLASSVGRLPAALDHFEAARAFHERMNARPLVCRTLYRHAEALLRTNGQEERRRAGELAREALEIGRAVGAPSLVGAAEAAAGAAIAAEARPVSDLLQ